MSWPSILLLHDLIDCVFQHDPAAIQQIKKMYAQQKPASEENEVDEETALLIEEMAISDQANTTELNALRGEINKKRINALNQKRKQDALIKLEKQKAAAARANVLKAKNLKGAGKFGKQMKLTVKASTSTSAPALALAEPCVPLASAASSGSLDPSSSASAAVVAVAAGASTSGPSLAMASGTAAPNATSWQKRRVEIFSYAWLIMNSG